jgi:DNA repair protein NreA
MRCAECKGRLLCGLPACPVMTRFFAQLRLRPAREYAGTAPSVFLGSRGFPAVRGGPLLVDDTDLPPDWIARGLTLEEIVGIRAGTIRGRTLPGRQQESLQEIALSARPMDVQVAFDRVPRFDLAFDGTVAPVGLTGEIRRMEVLGNPVVERPVERATSDTDLGAGDACTLLHRDGVDVYRIARLFTAGLLGRRRRMVPTRWAITAVDDSVFRGLRRALLSAPPLETACLHEATLFGNRILCLLAPGPWRFEMVEVWGRHSLWGGEEDLVVVDGERERKRGYSPITGAYYSARLAVAEHLNRLGRTATVLVVRAVSPDYWAPLGTWVVREATRQALREPPVECPSFAGALPVLAGRLGGYRWLDHSTLIPETRSQRRLSDY